MGLEANYQALMAMRDALGEDARSRRIKALIDRAIQLGIRFSVLSEQLKALEHRLQKHH